MLKYILKVPNTQNADDWFYFIRKNLKNIAKAKELIVDFNTVKFLDTDDFVVLACLIESYYINGSKISFIGGT